MCSAWPARRIRVFNPHRRQNILVYNYSGTGHFRIILLKNPMVKEWQSQCDSILSKLVLKGCML